MVLDKRFISKKPKSELVKEYKKASFLYDEMCRRRIVKENDMKFFADECFNRWGEDPNWEPQPFHLKMLQFQFQHPKTLQLCFRGAGKSTYLTIMKIIHYLVKDPNLRIIIVSRSDSQSRQFLNGVKQQLEQNKRLIELFGDFYNPEKWNEKEIVIKQRTSKALKEASVQVMAFLGSVVGRHYDIAIVDDLVDQSSAGTQTQRDKLLSWYNTSFIPAIEPADGYPHRGEIHHIGTRYHPEDLWNHLMVNEKIPNLTIPILDPGETTTPFPKRWSVEDARKKRSEIGTVIFNSQYQCSAIAMKGMLFDYADCQIVTSDSVYNGNDSIFSNLQVHIGVDLAISETEKADKNAITVLGVDTRNKKNLKFYVLDYYESIGESFHEMTNRIIEYYEKWDEEGNLVRLGIEKNSYQGAQLQNLKKSYQEKKGIPLRVYPIQTVKDKGTRFQKLTPYFKQSQVFFVVPGNESSDFTKAPCWKLIDQFVKFPEHRYDDGPDSFDAAMQSVLRSIGSKRADGGKRRKLRI